MFTIKNKLVCLLILILGLSASSFAQKKARYKQKEIIISAGCVNGKAINLVKPVYPSVANAVRAYGTISVSVIIDEKGKVTEAKATSGHFFLRPSSIKAALNSTFEPISVGGKPIKVSGIILYNYVPDTYNWLEIGYEFNRYRFLEMLPAGFEKEKELFQAFLESDFETRSAKKQNAIFSIEERLKPNYKWLWLFRVGRYLSEIYIKNPSLEELNSLTVKLRELDLNYPPSVSKLLIPKLELVIKLLENPQLNTYEPLKGNKLNQLLLEIQETLPILGI